MEVGDELNSKGTGEILKPVVCRKASNHNLTSKYAFFWGGETINSHYQNSMVNPICNGKHPCHPNAIMLVQKLPSRVTTIILPHLIFGFPFF